MNEKCGSEQLINQNSLQRALVMNKKGSLNTLIHQKASLQAVFVEWIASQEQNFSSFSSSADNIDEWQVFAAERFIKIACVKLFDECSARGCQRPGLKCYQLPARLPSPHRVDFCVARQGFFRCPEQFHDPGEAGVDVAAAYCCGAFRPGRQNAVGKCLRKRRGK